MHHLRQENLPFVGSSHEFVGAEQGDTGVSVFLFHGKPGPGGSPVRDRVRTGTLMTRSSLSVKGGEYGPSTARRSRAVREISLSSRPVRSIASRRLVIRRWYNSTFTSVPDSSKRTCRVAGIG